MYLTKVENLKVGDVLARKVYTADYQVLLKEGVELNNKYITRLKHLGIKHVYLKDKASEEVEIIDAISEEIKGEAINLAKQSLDTISELSLEEQARVKKIVDTEEIEELINKIVENILESPDIFISLKDIRDVDEELFFHLTNVTTISLIVAKILNYGKREMLDLGVGAFLHDLGKIKVPSEILNKPGALTDEEFAEVKKHTIYGYQLLKQFKKLPKSAVLVAKQHHEREDGSGYPSGLTGEKTHVFAKIVAIADIFDALQNDRVYRSGLKVNTIIRELYDLANKNQLDIVIVEQLVSNLVAYPVGSRVKLSNGFEGVVVELNSDALLRPIIKVLKEDGQELAEAFIVDLSEEMLAATISEVI
ncbi:HD-GYP domain-containing protein [Fuchsiella alkaliacetigena]|uniref:HD-GYP domain-containing protein n=1 Tax=Fuchsiella alkaliacetigena TaxID=957042 RepID=UPI002009DD8C|nr:HD-GYP domain-containing protein [Fuchsiella alkaliacetigena]MCK8825687.1 HD-GYP domain-containing protein [Fuchsiella alkaliacetigena]